MSGDERVCEAECGEVLKLCVDDVQREGTDE